MLLVPNGTLQGAGIHHITSDIGIWTLMSYIHCRTVLIHEQYISTKIVIKLVYFTDGMISKEATGGRQYLTLHWPCFLNTNAKTGVLCDT